MEKVIFYIPTKFIMTRRKNLYYEKSVHMTGIKSNEIKNLFTKYSFDTFFNVLYNDYAVFQMFL